MNPESPFTSMIRQFHRIPLITGIVLMIISVILAKHPMLLVYIVAYILAASIFLGGLFLTLIGLDLWRSMRNWDERVRSMRWRPWPRDRE